MNRLRMRWVVPGAVAAVIAAGVAVPALATADDATDLPELSVEQVLTAMAEAEPVPMSGTAVYTARLGLPEIPAELTNGADPLNLLAGSSTIRTWTDGVDRSRVSLLGQSSEYSVVTDGAEAWTYSSGKDEVQHVTLDADSVAQLEQAQQDREAAVAAGDVPTPEELATTLLDKAGENAEITIADPVTVAGRSAYQLVVTPSDDGTLVDRVVVAVDGETFIPLSAQVWSVRNADAPALDLSYTDLSLAAPSDQALTFSAPAGAEVEEKVVDLSDHLAEAEAQQGSQTEPELPEGVTVTGEGFATVVERTEVDVQGLLAGDGGAVADAFPGADGASGELMEEFGRPDGLDSAALYDQLTTPVDGGRMLTSALVSVLITDDGRVLVGAVPAETLLSAAGLT